MNPFLQLAGDLARETHERRTTAPTTGRLAAEVERERRRRARKGRDGAMARALKRAKEMKDGPTRGRS